jgi:hypothetical protein
VLIHLCLADGLLVGQFQAAERALWIALRILEERAIASRSLARRASESKNFNLGRSYEERSQQALEHAAALRELLLHFFDAPTE